MYRKLQEMRLFEKRAYDLFMKQLVKGTSHLSLGWRRSRPGRCSDAPGRLHLRQGGRGIGIRSMTHLVLSYDHRLVDGADAARFLTTIKDRLEAGRFQDDLV